MIIEYYNIDKTKDGYILHNQNSKYVLNQSKKSYGADYYLKLIEPIEVYITGLFFSPKHNLYKGKDTNGRAVKVKFLPTKAKIIID